MRKSYRRTRGAIRALSPMLALVALLSCSSNSEEASVGGVAVERTSTSAPNLVTSTTSQAITGVPGGSYAAPDGRVFEISAEGAVLTYREAEPSSGPSTSESESTPGVGADVSIGSGLVMARGVELLGAEPRDGGMLSLRFACQRDDNDRVSAVSMFQNDGVLWVFGEVESVGGGAPCTESSELAIELPVPAHWAESREVRVSKEPL